MYDVFFVDLPQQGVCAIETQHSVALQEFDALHQPVFPAKLIWQEFHNGNIDTLFKSFLMPHDSAATLNLLTCTAPASNTGNALPVVKQMALPDDEPPRPAR